MKVNIFNVLFILGEKKTAELIVTCANVGYYIYCAKICENHPETYRLLWSTAQMKWTESKWKIALCGR